MRRSSIKHSKTSLVPIAIIACIVTACFYALAHISLIPNAPRYQGSGHSTPKYGGTFTFHHESNVRGLDPHVSFDELSSTAIRLIFDGLLDYDGDARLVPSLATALPDVSADGMCFTFRLRPGIRFHNQEELTAHSVRWSMEHMLHRNTHSPGFPFYKAIVGAEDFHSGDAEHVEGIEVLDRHTIRFRLREPDQTFLNAMAMPFAYPVPQEMYAEGRDPRKTPIGTGPFRLLHWERGVRLIFERNTEYWNEGKPYVDRMIFLENLGRNLAVTRFLNGDLDTAHRFSVAHYHLFKSGDFSGWHPFMHEYPKITLWGFAMNTELPPFDNMHIRRAVAFAIDREAWSRARGGRISPHGQPIPPQLMGFDPDLEHAQRFDLEQARTEMRLAGHPVVQTAEGWRAEGIAPITVWMGESPGARQLSALLKQDLSAIGLEVKARHVSFSLYLQQTGTRGTAQMAFSGWSMDFPDPDNFLFLWHSGSIAETNSNNRSFYSNAAVDQLLDEARAERDTSRREKLYRKASNILAREAPWAFTFVDRSLEAWQPYVRNYRPHPVWSANYRDVWLDLPLRPFKSATDSSTKSQKQKTHAPKDRAS
ncbi:MAG: ABC transporter substrate-binding protein [Myxococcota bacterium]